MITLTSFANFSRKATFFSALGLAAILLLFILVIFGVNIKNALFPPKPLPASVAFGILPKTDFSGGIQAKTNINYKIDTISGDLPPLAVNAKVFVVDNVDPTFSAISEARKKAQRAGFTGDPIIIPGGFKFVDTNDNSKVLIIDSTNGNFIFQTNMQNVQKPVSTQSAIDFANNFLAPFGLSINEFPVNKIQIDNLKIINGNLANALSLSDADIVRLNFYRADLDGLPIVPILDGQSQIWTLVGNRGVVGAKMNMFNLSRFKFATYPLKGTQKAFSDLQSGKAVFNKDFTGNTFDITDVTLGYVESDNTKGFLEPVYIFKSQNSLAAFVSAVSDNWISN